MYSNWQEYADTLERMNRVSERWAAATNFEQLDSLIRLGCPELIDPQFVYEHGFDKLHADLAAQEYSGDEDRAALRIMFAATSRPAAEYDHLLTGSDYGYPSGAWDRFFINTRDDVLVYSEEQFADPDRWTPVEPAGTDEQEEEEDGGAQEAQECVYYPPNKLWYRGDDWFLKADAATRVVEDEDITDFYRDDEGHLYRDGKPADLHEEHFLKKLRRWRQQRRDGEFEFYHDAAAGWYTYDPASDYWFDGGAWVKYDELVGSLAARAREASGPSSADEAVKRELEEHIAQERETELTDLTTQIKSTFNITDEAALDGLIADLFDAKVASVLAAGAQPTE